MDRLSQVSFSSAPRLVWDSYVELLWAYKPDSWVARLAYSFRILAVLLVLPVIVLTLLDITSYVIARTLGVVDDVKVSTTAKLPHPHHHHHGVGSASLSASASSTPIVLVEDVSSSPSFSEDAPSADEGGALGQHMQRGTEDEGSGEDELRPLAYFASEDGLQLSGVGVFSPAASQPPSPVQSRAKLHQQDPTVESVREEGNDGVEPKDGRLDMDEGITLRRRGRQQQQSANNDDEKDES